MVPFLLLLFLLQCTSTTTIAQGPAAAPAPASPGPLNVTKILEKAKEFTILIRLLRATRVEKTLYGQLNNSNNAMTIFAPSDSAFSSLKTGTLNSMSDQDKTELLQFHILPQYLAPSQFQTVSNPVNTQAGSGDRLQLNITTIGKSVNISTGLTNTSISDTVYSDGQLAIYKVDKVLLPIDIFTPKPPAPAPAPEKSKKKAAHSIAESPLVPEDSSACIARLFLTYNVVCFFVTFLLTALCS